MKKILLIFAFASLFGLNIFGQSNNSLALGNPSNAKTDSRQPNNYLVFR